MHRSTLRRLLLRASLGVAGCAAGQRAPGAADRELVPGDASVVVRVRNNLVPRRSVVISVIGTGRPERVLGTLPSDDTGAWLVSEVFGARDPR